MRTSQIHQRAAQCPTQVLNRARRAFSLIEVIVSVALVLFIMLLLSEAFSAAIGTFRGLKGIGDMEEKLRGVMITLRRDLSASHFEGTRRLSDPDFWTKGPPQQGFFRIWQGSPIQYGRLGASALPNNQWEGVDFDGGKSISAFNSTRMTHQFLHMTVRMQGHERRSYFATDISADYFPNGQSSPLVTYGRPDGRYQFSVALNPNATSSSYPGQANFTSQWVEVAFFMRRTGTTAPSANGLPGLPLFALHRRQLLVAPNTDRLNFFDPSNPPPDGKGNLTRSSSSLLSTAYAEVSCVRNPSNPGLIYFNSLSDLTIPQRRYGMDDAADSAPTSPTNGGLLRTLPNDGSPLPTYPRIDESVLTSNSSAQWPANGLTLSRIGSPSLATSDLVLNDVVSFETRILVEDGQGLSRSGVRGFANNPNLFTNDPSLRIQFDPFIDLYDSQAWLPEARALGISPLTVMSSNNTRFQGTDPATGLPVGPRCFDTWSNQNDGTFDYSGWSNSPASSTTVPLPIRILAVQVTLRVWDRNTQQTRQVTLIQDM